MRKYKMHDELNVVAITHGCTMAKINSRINLKPNILAFRWITIHFMYTNNEFQFKLLY